MATSQKNSFPDTWVTSTAYIGTNMRISKSLITKYGSYIYTQLIECLSVCFTSLCKKQYHKKSKIEQESYEKASWKERDICKEISFHI